MGRDGLELGLGLDLGLDLGLGLKLGFLHCAARKRVNTIIIRKVLLYVEYVPTGL